MSSLLPIVLAVPQSVSGVGQLGFSYCTPSFLENCWERVGGRKVYLKSFLKNTLLSLFFSINIQMATDYVLLGSKLPKVNGCKRKKHCSKT